MARRYYKPMIQEDRSKESNLPTGIIQKSYEAMPETMDMVDSLYSAAKTQLHEDAKQFKKALKPSKQ